MMKTKLRVSRLFIGLAVGTMIHLSSTVSCGPSATLCLKSSFTDTSVFLMDTQIKCDWIWAFSQTLVSVTFSFNSGLFISCLKNI